MDWLFTYADPTIDWDYAMITLVVRFIGVFFVMFVMQVAMQLSARAVRYIEARGEAVPAGAGAAPVAAAAGASAPADESGAAAADGATIAAIGAALQGADSTTAAAIGLALSLETHARPDTMSDSTSSWAAAGRLQQLTRLPR